MLLIIVNETSDRPETVEAADETTVLRVTWVVRVGDSGADGVGLQGERGWRRHSCTQTQTLYITCTGQTQTVHQTLLEGHQRLLMVTSRRTHISCRKFKYRYENCELGWVYV